MSDARRKLMTELEGVDALRWIASLLVLGPAGFFTLFVGGEAMADPGGWVGIGGSAAVVVFMVGLGALALFRPGVALVALAVAACAPLAFGVWSLVDYPAASTWEDTHGPISLVLVVAVCAPAAVAGLFRTRGAGYLILVVTVVPIVLATLGAASYRPLMIGLLQLPFIISGALFLVAHRQQENRQRSAVVPGTPAVQRHRARQ